MSEPRPSRVSAAQAAAFRLQRHHFTAERSNASILDVVRDSGGIRAQVQSAAEMAIWTRRRQTRRDDVRGALWDRRELVKTSAMRLTLHLIPAADFAVYIAAMRPTSRAVLARWQGRLKITATHVRMMIDTVLEALADGALPQQELVAREAARAERPASYQRGAVPPRTAGNTARNRRRGRGAERVPRRGRQPAWSRYNERLFSCT